MPLIRYKLKQVVSKTQNITPTWRSDIKSEPDISTGVCGSRGQGADIALASTARSAPPTGETDHTDTCRYLRQYGGQWAPARCNVGKVEADKLRTSCHVSSEVEARDVASDPHQIDRSRCVGLYSDCGHEKTRSLYLHVYEFTVATRAVRAGVATYAHSTRIPHLAEPRRIWRAPPKVILWDGCAGSCPASLAGWWQMVARVACITRREN